LGKILLLAIVIPGLYLLSARQRKILFNLIMSWALSIMNWMLMFFLGFWTTMMVLDTDVANNLLSDDDTEQISEDPEQTEDTPESTEEDLTEPSEKIDDEINKGNKDDYNDQESLPQPTRAYT
jgi:nucleosome binding factor SPN SPT16 subunit